MNHCVIVGNLGGDPDVRTTGNGTVVANLSVATKERVKTGELWETTTEWHRIVCFGKTAENVAKYLTKGSQVGVVGRLRTNKWTDKEGNERKTTEIVASEVEFMGGGNKEQNKTREKYNEPSADGDIPF